MTTQTAAPFPVMQTDHSVCFVYYGDHERWYIALSVHRDSDILARSNWRVISADMEARFPQSVASEESSHWLVGWAKALLVDPANSEAVDAALEWKEKLDDYPVADDEDLTELEYDEGYCSSCGAESGLLDSYGKRQEVCWHCHTNEVTGEHVVGDPTEGMAL